MKGFAKAVLAIARRRQELHVGQWKARTVEEGVDPPATSKNNLLTEPGPSPRIGWGTR